MIKMIIDKLNTLEVKVKKIMKNGMRFSLFVCLISALILVTYQSNLNPDLFYIGLSVFKLGLFFIVDFIICGIAIDTIKGQMC